MAEYTIDKIEYGGNVYKLQDNVSGYTTNSGTVTSVGISNATNGGLSISGSPITSSGTISVGHSNVLSSAQTTQAVYPIKIDKNGHISAYGSAVTIPTIPSNNVTGSGSTNYLARWSGTNTLSTTSLSISTSYNSSSDLYGTIKLYVGSTGQLDWKGQLVFYGGNSSKTVTITPPTLTASRTITLPDKTGTIALTSDLPTVPSNIVNTITTTAGTHTAITSQTGSVSFKVPTKTSHLTNDSGFITNAGVTSITTTAGAHTAITNATGAVSFSIPTTAAHVGAASSSHTHGNITNGGDITATAPTIASGDQIIINDHSASKITNGPTFDGSTTTTALTPKGTWETFSKFSGSYNDLTNKPTIPTLPSNIVNTITTTAGAHTAITSSTGAVSFNVPTKTSHLTNDSGFITSYADEKIKLTSQSTSGTYPLIFGPTSITSNSTYQGYYNTGITVNPSTKTVTATTFVGALTGTASGNLTSSSTLDATKLSGTIPSGCYTNTTYGISGSLSNHAFTSTLTAGGSGTTSVLTLAAGTGITLTDDTTNKKITIACNVTNTDKRLEVSEATSGIFYYPILSTGTTVAETRRQDTTGFSYVGTTGSGSTSGTATLALGNNVAGSSGKCGYLDIYGIGQYKATLRLGSALTANRLINLPNKDGTIALTSDLIPKPSDEGSFGFVLKYITANRTVWDAPDLYEVGIVEDVDNPGTYILNNIASDVRDAAMSGQKLALRLGLYDTIGTDSIADDYIFTNYEVEQHYDESTDNSYMVIRFQGRMNLEEATVTIYLDETESLYTDGEVHVEKKIAAHAGDSGSEGIVVGDWKICWGLVTLNTNSASGSGTYTAPYYADSSSIALNYTGVPYVWCQVVGSWTGTRYATPHDISETGFYIRLYASHKNSSTTSIRWLSIGKA